MPTGAASRTLRLIPLLALLCGCAVLKSERVARIVLLSSFEGRYREIGYDALYAARLAFADAADSSLELLAVDDGGTQQRAVERARALALDPTIVAVVVLGYHAAAPETLAALGDIPVLIVGNWSEAPPSSTVYMLSNPALNAQITAPPSISLTDAAALESPVVGGEVFALEGLSELRTVLDGVTVVSSGSLPDADFLERYRASDQFVPEPRLLTTLVYDAFGILLQQGQAERSSTNDHIRAAQYEGLNGAFTFSDNIWEQAPIHTYIYQDGVLTAADNVVEQR